MHRIEEERLVEMVKKYTNRKKRYRYQVMHPYF